VSTHWQCGANARGSAGGDGSGRGGVVCGVAGAGRRARWSESGLGAMAGARMGGDHVDGEDGEELEESAQGRAGYR